MRSTKPSAPSHDPAPSVEVTLDIARAFTLRCQHAALSPREGLALLALFRDPMVTASDLATITGSRFGGTLAGCLKKLRTQRLITFDRDPDPSSDQRRARYTPTRSGRTVAEFLRTGTLGPGTHIPPFHP